VTTPERRRTQVQEATLYVATRFYPPLPLIYGELAVLALEAYYAEGPSAVITLPRNLNPVPRQATYNDETNTLEVRALDLIGALRITHMLSDDDDEEF
jgi:hypothetical protein